MFDVLNYYFVCLSDFNWFFSPFCVWSTLLIQSAITERRKINIILLLVLFQRFSDCLLPRARANRFYKMKTTEREKNNMGKLINIHRDVDVRKAYKKYFLTEFSLCVRFPFLVLHGIGCFNRADGACDRVRPHWIGCWGTYFKLLRAVWRWNGDFKSIYFIGSNSAVLYDGQCYGHG